MLDSSEYTVYPGIMKSYFSVTGILAMVQKSWEAEEEYIKLSHSNSMLVPCLHCPKSHGGAQGRNKDTRNKAKKNCTWTLPETYLAHSLFLLSSSQDGC